MGIAYTVLDSSWRAVACYLAYLELAPRGDKSQNAKQRLNELASEADADFEKQWLLGLARNFEASLQSSSSEMAQAFCENRSGGQDEKSYQDTNRWSRDFLHAKSHEWTLPHLEAWGRFYDEGKPRAAIVQVLEALEVCPLYQEPLVSLALCYATMDEKARAFHLSKLIRRDELDPQGLRLLSILLEKLE